MDPQDIASYLGYGQPDAQGVLGLGASPDAPDLVQAPSPGIPQQDPNALPLNQPGVDPSTPVAPPGQVAPMLPGMSKGGSVSQQGFSQDKYNQVSKTGSTLDRQNAADRADIEGRYAPLKAEGDKAFAAEQAAVAQTSQAEAARIEAVGRGKQQIADAYDAHANQTQAAYTQAKTEADGLKNDYRASLADWAASRVNPAQLWESAGSGGRFGMMVTAFAHDFLGAKGIKTSAMDTWNQAVKQNIDSQLENIRHKREVASGFKDLWDMQRAQSATDAEARERVYGFHLLGLQNGIDAEMGKYDSKLAQAKGAAAKAAVSKAQADNDLSVQQHIDAAANARAAQRVQVYDAQLKASVARAEIASRESMAKAAADAKKQADPKGLADIVIDTSKSGGNTARWRFRPGTKDETKDKVKEKVAISTQAADLLTEYQDMQQKAKATPDLLKDSRFQGELRRKANALHNAWLATALLDSTGKASNQGEVDRMGATIPVDTMLTNGSTVGVIGQTIRTKLDESTRLLHSHADDMTQNDPAYGYKTGDSHIAEGEYAKASIEEQDDHGEPKNTPTDTAVQGYTRPDRHKAASESLKDKLAGENGQGYSWSPDTEYHEFLKSSPEHAQAGTKGHLFEDPTTADTSKEKPSAEVVSIMGLRHQAEDRLNGKGEVVAKGDPSALEKLQAWANVSQEPGAKDPAGDDPNSVESQAAQAAALWELSQISGK